MSVFLRMEGRASTTGRLSTWDRWWYTKESNVSNSRLEDLRDTRPSLSLMTKWSTTKPCSYPSLTEMAVLASVWLHLLTMKFYNVTDIKLSVTTTMLLTPVSFRWRIWAASSLSTRGRNQMGWVLMSLSRGVTGREELESELESDMSSLIPLSRSWA